ncbi:radical SAM family heme chaperone HemW [Bacillus horti]|uniref:Heme chaperone HemW n=1 Tax=Caldalkalibacillus horti TaxID=77523 RepID=A0ABT9W475_9BACI|nr:radical SAM family heme chaperone HemW [Bacillus horti]MDQ0168029.1 oxygen-independent coproporphyrinogen-3 oxidase [Bacillus horti]
MPRAVYIHIPFCNRICPYCDFNKYVFKGQPVQEYVQALEKEMLLTFPFPSYSIPLGEGIQTIFVGGGTPTVLTAEQLKEFLQSIKRQISFSELVEFTFEANPETIDKEKLDIMLEYGVNRLSFGVQTFDRELLKRLGRMHSPEDVYSSISLARQSGFKNISIDLMFGLPNQSLATFHETLDISFELGVEHFSAYSLKVEEGTFFHKLYQKDKLPLPTEEDEVRMYSDLMERMRTEGYEQYEISNFSKPGFRSTHNLTYWRNAEYYGLGAGAHGYVQGRRHVNIAGVQEYIDTLAQDKLPYVSTHDVLTEEAMEDYMIMGLRTREGVSSIQFQHNFHQPLEEVYTDQLQELIQDQLIERTGDKYRLTREGMFLGNEVFEKFLH